MRWSCFFGMSVFCHWSLEVYSVSSCGNNGGVKYFYLCSGGCAPPRIARLLIPFYSKGFSHAGIDHWVCAKMWGMNQTPFWSCSVYCSVHFVWYMSRQFGHNKGRRHAIHALARPYIPLGLWWSKNRLGMTTPAILENQNLAYRSPKRSGCSTHLC